ncbi:uncharacterized protein LOC130725640 [Lotus japonicus]|uniref:uncharacterized protein LOC130725640 n=1 Tax=Lotus japonicus TaxID=34305 RepID=UPI002586C968|nr:uncharacterized protein LOC130725640 [Lotus japonicus]
MKRVKEVFFFFFFLVSLEGLHGRVRLNVYVMGFALVGSVGSVGIVVFSDSRDALSLLEHGCGRFHAYAAVFGLVRELLSKDWVVRFDQILREGITIADFLAKDGARGTCQMRCLDSPPTEAAPLLAAEYRGTLFMRR